MNILYISPEIAPFAKTGGLADVASALPQAIRKLGHDIRAVMPRYATATTPNAWRLPLGPVEIHLHDGVHRAVIWQDQAGDVPVYQLQNSEYFNRQGIYGEGGRDYDDNLTRFVFFCRAALQCCRSIGFEPDIIHANDWQTALTPALVGQSMDEGIPKALFFKRPGLVFSIHNISYQGVYPESFWPLLTLDRRFYPYDFEYYGQISLMKGALQLSDAIHTVSRTYAREIQETELGFGLQGVLHHRKDRIFGILNGVDYKHWSPETDDYTFGIHYSPQDLSGKRRIKSRLREQYGLPDIEDAPLIGLVSRMVAQKGMDLVMECGERMLWQNTQLIVLGFGEQRYHDYFQWLAATYPDRARLYIGFNNELAHQIEAACDLFLMPSRFEPCGLNQLYSLKYGTLPIVRRTGGLADTIVDGENGFSFDDYSADALLNAVARACGVFRTDPEGWRRMVVHAMNQDYSWKTSARQYLDMYRFAIHAATGRG